VDEVGVVADHLRIAALDAEHDIGGKIGRERGIGSRECENKSENGTERG